ncbi:MAG: hypothetical protein HW385_1057, partial [candidate division NC10 bacterium]|nr:hypothetical protein [candidate division NC10 bacterium]
MTPLRRVSGEGPKVEPRMREVGAIKAIIVNISLILAVPSLAL